MQTVPYTIWDDTTPKGRKLLTAAHDQIMAYHANASIELPAGTPTRYPTQAIVALWDPAITWIGGGWSAFKVTLRPASYLPVPLRQCWLGCNLAFIFSLSGP